MKRVYKEIEKFRFEGGTTPIKPGDVVILKLCTGEHRIYTAVHRTKRYNSDFGIYVICDGCSFEGTGTCPFLAHVYTDTSYGGKRLVRKKRALEDHCLCQSQLMGGNKVIFKSVDTMLEDL